ncbi:MAG: sigma 54-interacting transcriptional regulator [Myxococcota bacterium]
MVLSTRILVIDEDPAFRLEVRQQAEALGYQASEVETARAGLTELAAGLVDAVVVDSKIADVPVRELVALVAAQPSPRPAIIVTARASSVEDAVELMRRGVKDVVMKPATGARLKDALARAIESSDLARDVKKLRPASEADNSAVYFAGDSAAMAAVFERIDRLASVEMPILLIGEAGVGKGAIARRIHAKGPRAQRPMVVVPDADPATVEQTLFGAGGRPGAFTMAQDGVLFIESIVSLGTSGQERLAKLLAEVSTARTGGQPVSWPRLIVGAPSELAALVDAQTVLPELARRLSPLTVHVPALRDRRTDVAAIVYAITARAAKESGRPIVEFAPEVLDRLSREPWPTNVRGLEAAVLRAIAMAKDGLVRLDELEGAPGPVAHREEKGRDAQGWTPTLDANGEVMRYDEYEAEIFRFALDRAGGCVSRAAEMLGVGRATMYRKMRSYDIDAPPVSERAIVRSGRRARDEKDPLPGRAA